jgi:CheY-like chemotaxis protein
MIVTPMPVAPETAATASLRILIAEDSPMNIIIMKKLLSMHSLGAIFVTNGEEAVAAMQTADYDVVLMDIYMPRMDGYEATGIIRGMEDKNKADVHIIALTAAAEMFAADKIKAAGFDDYIAKPLNIAELVSKLAVLSGKIQ